MDFYYLQMAVNNKTWILVWDVWPLGGLTTKMKVCRHIWIEKGKFLFNKIFRNFDISEKKSAGFSCLFTFFQKNCKIKIIFTTFWELHNCLFKFAICLHFWNKLIYVVILNCKQLVNICSQLYDSQNVVKIIMIL